MSDERIVLTELGQPDVRFPPWNHHLEDNMAGDFYPPTGRIFTADPSRDIAAGSGIDPNDPLADTIWGVGTVPLPDVTVRTSAPRVTPSMKSVTAGTVAPLPPTPPGQPGTGSMPMMATRYSRREVALEIYYRLIEKQVSTLLYSSKGDIDDSRLVDAAYRMADAFVNHPQSQLDGQPYMAPIPNYVPPLYSFTPTDFGTYESSNASRRALTNKQEALARQAQDAASQMTDQIADSFRKQAAGLLTVPGRIWDEATIKEQLLDPVDKTYGRSSFDDILVTTLPGGYHGQDAADTPQKRDVVDPSDKVNNKPPLSFAHFEIKRPPGGYWACLGSNGILISSDDVPTDQGKLDDDKECSPAAGEIGKFTRRVFALHVGNECLLMPADGCVTRLDALSKFDSMRVAAGKREEWRKFRPKLLEKLAYCRERHLDIDHVTEVVCLDVPTDRLTLMEIP